MNAVRGPERKATGAPDRPVPQIDGLEELLRSMADDELVVSHRPEQVLEAVDPGERPGSG